MLKGGFIVDLNTEQQSSSWKDRLSIGVPKKNMQDLDDQRQACLYRLDDLRGTGRFNNYPHSEIKL